MVSKTWMVHLFIFMLQFDDIDGNRTYTKEGCYNNDFTTGLVCNRAKMYPKTFTTRTLQNPWLCHRHPKNTGCEPCCQKTAALSKNNTPYELPADALKFPGNYKSYKDVLTLCTGMTKCQMAGMSHIDCFTFEYECVDDNQILNFTGDATLTDTQVFLLHDRKTHSVKNSHCVAYSCQSSINVKLVGNTVNSSSCTLVFSEEGRSPTVFKCKTATANNTLYQSNSSKVHITMNMTASATDLLWIRVTASNGGNVSVACGSKIPSDVTTPRLVQTVKIAIAYTSESPTLDTTHVKTPSVTMKPQTTQSNTPIIGGVVGGLVAALCLSAIFVVYKKCCKKNKIEDESALAANVDAPIHDMPKTPDSRRVWAESAGGTGMNQGSPPTPFGAASLQMPRPANSLPPIRHIDFKI